MNGWHDSVRRHALSCIGCPFPINIEYTLWRISTLKATLASLLLPLITHGHSTLEPTIYHRVYDRSDQVLHRCTVYILLPVVSLIHIGSRLCVIGLALTNLRSMSEDVYKQFLRRGTSLAFTSFESTVFNCSIAGKRLSNAAQELEDLLGYDQRLSQST